MRIAVNGVCGRMGRAVERLAREQGFEVAVTIDAPGKGTADRLETPVDALIDFSTPEGAMARLEECVQLRAPMVVCTTGFREEEQERIRAAAREIPIMLSSNMSLGMNLLFKLAPEVASALGEGYDLDIIETHHRFKKDAPSGSAKTLAAQIEAKTGRRPNVAAVRSGDVVGEHRLVFGGLGESIEIVHRANTRDIFARGALRAAEFLSRATPGLYSMTDVLRRNCLTDR